MKFRFLPQDNNEQQKLAVCQPTPVSPMVQVLQLTQYEEHI